MGNKSSRAGIGLKLDQQSHVAGGWVTGAVYVSIGKKQSPQWDSVQLSLKGTESTTIQVEGNDKNRREIRHSTAELVHTEVKLADFPPGQQHGKSNGQFEYPFRFRLPSHLPSSMECQDPQNRSNQVSIKYILAAHIFNEDGSIDDGMGTGAVHNLNVNAEPLSSRPSPMIVETETFNVKQFCLWKRGSISLGWQVDQPTGSPGETIPIRIWGENQSSVDISHISAIWYENVTWTSADNSQRKTFKRVLTKQRIMVDSFGHWRATDRPSGQRSSSILSNETLTGNIVLPRDARDTYSGTLVNVSHVLVVKASTDGWAFSSPESACSVRVSQVSLTNEDSGATELPPVEAEAFPVPTSPSVVFGVSGQEVFVEAEAIPSDWEPETSPVVVIPAEAILTDQVVTPTRQSRASAPDEHHVQSRGSSARLSLAEELVAAATICPENVPAILEDPERRGAARELDSAEIANILRSTSTDSHKYSLICALCLAIQPNLRCSQLAACLRSIPPQQRAQVLDQFGPMIRDIDENLHLIDDEMTSSSGPSTFLVTRQQPASSANACRADSTTERPDWLML